VPDLATLGVIATMIALNMTMLGIVLRQMTNGSKPKLPKNNPRPVNPKEMDTYRLGDVSVAYFEEHFVAPIIEAIRGNR
jgi:hypothetical protein